MAGSEGGKQSKNKKPEVFNPKLPLAQLNNNLDGQNDVEDKNPESNMSTIRSKYGEKEVEEFLYMKLEALYARAKDLLLESGFCPRDIETAFLSAGDVCGQMDPLRNILTNSIAFMKKRIKLTREPFKDMDALYKAMRGILVDFVTQTRPDMPRFDAMVHLLVSNWGVVPSYEKVGIMKTINFTPVLESYLAFNVHSLTADLQRKAAVPEIMQRAIPTNIVSADFLTSETGCSYECLNEWLDSNSDEPETAQIEDLIKTIRELQEKAKEQKEWAQKKLIDSARRLSTHFMEINRLRMEKGEKEKMKDEKLHTENSCMSQLMEMEHSLRKVNIEASCVTDAVRRLERKNAQIRADTEALKLNGSESERELKEILKREKKCTKKLSDIGKQISNSQSQCEAEKERLLQLELELLQAKKETEEAEVKWRREIKEKEDMFALVAEEVRMSEIQKANSRAELSKLRQKVEIDSQLDMDECQRLEDELSRLRLRQQMENVNLRYNNAEASTSSSSETSARVQSSERRIGHCMCMMCLQNEVSVVFLPCTHQVICFPCYERNCSKTVGPTCPYCDVRIKESIRVFGPN